MRGVVGVLATPFDEHDRIDRIWQKALGEAVLAACALLGLANAFIAR